LLPRPIVTTAAIGSCGKTLAISAPVATDNCSIASITNNSTYATSPTNASGFYPVGITTFDWTISDINGNSVVCHQTITINDIEAPSISCNPLIEAMVTTDECSAFVNILSPVVSDNCGSYTLTNDSPFRSSDTNASLLIPMPPERTRWELPSLHGQLLIQKGMSQRVM